MRSESLGGAVVRGWPWLAGALLVAAGLAGLDPLLYAWCRDHTMPDPTNRALYERTAWLWTVMRLPASAAGGLAVFFLLLLLDPRRWLRLGAGLAACLSAGVAGSLLKMIVGRVRPNQAPAGSHLVFLPPLRGFAADAGVSFPSGEATAAFALATILTILYPRGRWFFYAAAAVAAGSRLLKAAHYLSDVAAGALLGTFVAGWTFRVLDRRAARVSPSGGMPS